MCVACCVLCRVFMHQKHSALWCLGLAGPQHKPQGASNPSTPFPPTTPPHTHPTKLKRTAKFSWPRLRLRCRLEFACCRRAVWDRMCVRMCVYNVRSPSTALPYPTQPIPLSPTHETTYTPSPSPTKPVPRRTHQTIHTHSQRPPKSRPSLAEPPTTNHPPIHKTPNTPRTLIG